MSRLLRYHHASACENDTSALAKALSSIVMPETVVLLTGDLASGKTFFTRALIRTLVAQEDLIVNSPTFCLLNQYEWKLRNCFINHFDFYRLQVHDATGMYQEFNDYAFGNVNIVEWPQLLDAYWHHWPQMIKIVITSKAHVRYFDIETYLPVVQWEKESEY